MPCSAEAHTRFCDDHVLDAGAVSVPRVSLSSSPTAPSVQTKMVYPWVRCRMSCRVESRKVPWPQATEGVESYEHKIQNCLRELRKTSDVEIVRRKECEIRRTDSEEKKMCGSNVIDDLKVELQKRRAREERSVGDAEAASGSTMKEPWPKPVGDSQKSPKVPARRALHPEDSVRVPKRAAGHLGRSSSQTSDRVSTTRTCRPK